MNRPNPRVATVNVVIGLDQGNDEAIDRMRRQLARAWAAGYRAGWDDGVFDATRDSAGMRITPSPYTTTTHDSGTARAPHPTRPSR